MFRKDRDKKSRSRSPKRDKRKDSSSKSPRRSRDKSKDRSNRESSDKGSPPQGDQEQILDEIRPSYSRSRSRSAPRSHRSEKSPRSERSARSGTRSPRADREDNEDDWGGGAGRYSGDCYYFPSNFIQWLLYCKKIVNLFVNDCFNKD